VLSPVRWLKMELFKRYDLSIIASNCSCDHVLT
jgi:hypothetical protein